MNSNAARQNSFYDRTNALPAEEVKAGIRRNVPQRDRVEDLLFQNSHRTFTAFEVEEYIGIDHHDVRRCFTNLCDDKKIIFEGMTIGRKGKSVGKYRYAPPGNTQLSMGI